MSLATKIQAVSLLQEDLDAARRFYADVLGLDLVFETEDSAVFRLGETLLNLLEADSAPELLDPVRVADPAAGARAVFTIQVEDVDSRVSELKQQGVEFVYGPRDQPWGPRTALFPDPGGHLWEVSS